MSRLSFDDEDLTRGKALIRELLDAKPEIMARVQRAGFSDIRDDEIMIVFALGRELNLQAFVDFATDPLIGDRAFGNALGRLSAGGYLEMRQNRDAPGRKAVSLSAKGLDLLRIVLEAIKFKRWADIPYREGDIVVCSVPKSGTTWMQMICALLIFQTPELPVPLQELSPWVEEDIVLRDDVLALLEGQQHRRLMKTHRSMADMPLDPRVTYVVIARRPLDAALSLYHHVIAESKDRIAYSELPSINDVVRYWMGVKPAPAKFPEEFRMRYMMAHLCDSWERREEPNVILVHYDDLLADLEGQMRGLAECMGITVPEATWPGLVRAATFKEMRAIARQVQPLPWLEDPTKFFVSGTSGGGREHLSNAEFAEYQELSALLAPPDLLAWVNREDGGVMGLWIVHE